MSSWIDKLLPPRVASDAAAPRRRSVPEGVWVKCPACGSTLYKADLTKNAEVCPSCNHHHRIRARARLDLLLDPEGRVELAQEVRPIDALAFVDSRPYPARLAESSESTGESDALIVISGTIRSQPAVVACFDFDFMGGSMGSVVGERFVRAVEAAIERHCGFVVIAASGGARMQEGLLSLMQMAKTTAAIQRMAALRLPTISVLTDPTMGGVSASFAFVTDVVLAEPKALIGFAGPRVIEQTVREKLPDGFQRSEFLLERGAIDRIVNRQDLAGEIAGLLSILHQAAGSSSPDLVG